MRPNGALFHDDPQGLGSFIRGISTPSVTRSASSSDLVDAVLPVAGRPDHLDGGSRTAR